MKKSSYAVRSAHRVAAWQAPGTLGSQWYEKEQLGKPIIAIVNSFTQFVPGHVHLHEIGQLVKKKLRSWDALLRNSIRLPLMMVLPWDMTECFIPFLPGISLPIVWNIW